MRIFPALLAIVAVLCLSTAISAQCGCQAPAQLSFGQNFAAPMPFQQVQSFGVQTFAAPAPVIVQQPVFAAPVILNRGFRGGFGFNQVIVAPRRFGFGFGGGVNVGVGFGGGFGRSVAVGGGRNTVFVGGGRGPVVVRQGLFGRTVIR